MPSRNAMRKPIAKFQSVVQHTFTEEQVELVKLWELPVETIFEMLDVLCLTGYEVSTRYDSGNESYSVCLKGVDVDCKNAGKWMYGNGKTLKLALTSALFKHFEVFGQKQWEDTVNMSSPDFS